MSISHVHQSSHHFHPEGELLYPRVHDASARLDQEAIEARTVARFLADCARHAEQ
jgi:hypothetical protein